METILFIGSKNLGYHCLQTLLHDDRRGDLFEIGGVLARSDDLETPDEMWWESVARLAKEHDLPLLIPDHANERSVIEEIQEWGIDLAFCVFYPQIFSKTFLEACGRGVANLHFAPLPRYRGVMPIPHAILNGEDSHGVTLHWMTTGIDDGPILSQTEVEIEDDDTGIDLYRRCESAGLTLFQESFPDIVRDTVEAEPQDEAEATYHKKGELDTREVELESWSEDRIDRFVRALEFPPYPLPYITVDGRKHHLRTKPGQEYTEDHLPGWEEHHA